MLCKTYLWIHHHPRRDGQMLFHLHHPMLLRDQKVLDDWNYNEVNDVRHFELSLVIVVGSIQFMSVCI